MHNLSELFIKCLIQKNSQNEISITFQKQLISLCS